MRFWTKLAALSLLFWLPVRVWAHCPLCTAGAGAAAAAAALLGVKYGAIAVFLGAFATALSLWLSHKVKRSYFKYQQWLLFSLIYFSTLLPLYPLLKGDYYSRYISVNGDYGSWLNRTYLVDLFWLGALAGTAIVLVAPRLSAYFTKRFGRTIKFQGLVVTFALLIGIALVIQLVPR